MINIVLAKKNNKLETLNKELGFTKTTFLDNIMLINAKTKKELLKNSKETRGKLAVYKPETEDMLRFALEKTPINVVYGLEQIHPKDSVHFVRGGLDQILCKIAATNGKTIAFSFSDILNSSEKGNLLARMMFNIALCRKYNVKMFFGTFAKDEYELRSASDLFSFWKVLGGTNKNCFIM
ncbi:hypothetical protein COV17_01480 [Candidatus Woesearchaeota archaeon CG10_big_fil_rev_8_21_14_0_10_36_11]|nr:MAG: hypothetical protein COV17_01480 [Candidatus Woesearchaeota archaeon CG10_big_fil_rev_8_21_14_0_10_36_11]